LDARGQTSGINKPDLIDNFKEQVSKPHITRSNNYEKLPQIPRQEMLNFIDEMHLTPEQVEFLKENKKSAFYAKLCGMSTRVKVF